MKILHSIALISITTSLLLATSQTQEEAQMQEVLKLGKQGSSLLGKTLGKNMKAHMKKGGPMDALNFCSTEAFDLTEGTSKKLPSGVKVKRISTNNRSVVNAPLENEGVILESLEKLQKSGVILPEYVVEKVNDKTFKYYKPIMIDNAVCLKCHGDLQEGAMKKAIQERYPDDKALGYKMNDLRGAVVVTIETK